MHFGLYDRLLCAVQRTGRYGLDDRGAIIHIYDVCRETIRNAWSIERYIPILDSSMSAEN